MSQRTDSTTGDDRPSIETLTPRDELYIAVADYIGDREEANATIDAYRAQVLAEAKVETVDWLVKKVSEYRSTRGRHHALQADAIEILASKLDRGAVRAFLGTAHYRDAMDAHRAEVLREAAKRQREFVLSDDFVCDDWEAALDVVDLIDPDEQPATTEAGVR